jgi:iron complex transport system ATP-binding protein
VNANTNNSAAIKDIVCQKLSYKVHNKTLLMGVDTVFNAGKISVVLGKNGAGKSTLLSLLTKEITATDGSILWHKKPIENCTFAELALQRSVLPQLQNMVFSLKVQQLIELGAEVQQKTNYIDDITFSVMQVCDIEHLAQRDVITLSGGEQKRVQLARVLAQIWPVEAIQSGEQNPFSGKWLFLDEWTTSLDLHHQQQLALYFKKWSQQGLGIVMVLHDLNLTSQLADQVKILKQGQLAIEGNALEVFTEKNVKQTLDLDIMIKNIESVAQPIIVPREVLIK